MKKKLHDDKFSFMNSLPKIYIYSFSVGKTCSAINCQNNKRKHPELVFFKFPLDYRCKKWIQNTRRADLIGKSITYCHNNLRLCSRHFEESQFTSSAKNRLIKTALPTLFDVANCPSRISSTRKRAVTKHVAAEKMPVTKNTPPTPTKKKLERAKAKISNLQTAVRSKNRAIKRLQKKILDSRKVESVIDAMKQYLQPDEHELVALQMRLSIKKRRVYNDAFKAFAVGMYFKSPSAYRFMQTRFHLPCKATICSWMSKIQFRQGLCDNLMKMLKVRTQRMNEEDRICTLMMDEVSLKRGLEYDSKQDKVIGVNSKGEYESGALVLLASGLKKYWRQAFSYHFVKNNMPAESLVPILLQSLSELKALGLKVVVICSDQGSNFWSLLSILGVDKDKPYFEHDGQVVFVCADVPHLIKNVRNCLSANDIVSSLGKADWNVILELYERDKKQEIRLCPKLRKKHFELGGFGAKMKVSTATQTISRSVSAAILTYSGFGQLGPHAQSTAHTLQWFNDLFDCLNSSKKIGKTRFQKGLTLPEDETLFPFLNKCKAWLSEMKIFRKTGKDVTNNFRFIQGWLLTINTITQLSKILHRDYDFQYLLTRRFCTDPLENLFCIIRSGRGFDQNPTCYGFAQSFKHAVTN